MLQRRNAVTAPVSLLVAMAFITACGAPRDPDLEKRAIKALAALEAERAATPAPSPNVTPPAPSPTELKTYTNDEMRRILNGIGGTGNKLWAEFRTQLGTIKCALDDVDAPQTVANFVGLATGQSEWREGSRGPNVRRPFYDGLTFHRAVANFIIQTGNPGREVGGGPGWTIPRETRAASAFDEPGALAMIDSGSDSHGSQLFITTRPDPTLKARYAAFGRCQEVDVVRAISNGEKVPSADGKASSMPRDPVKIFSVKISRGD